MPIKGLTDRGESFPEIGRIRKGSPKEKRSKNGREYEVVGKDLPYFRFELDEKEIEVAEAIKALYGPQPTDILVILPFNDIERMWDANLEAYVANRMIARADGEKFLYLVDTKTGEIIVKNGLDREGKIRPYFDGMEVGKDSNGKSITCKPSGRLKVILPQLARAAYLTLLTTSVHDIANISEQLAAFKALNNGTIAGIPFIVRRRPKKISVPTQDGKRARVIKYLISIEADPEWVKTKLNEIKYHALPGNGLALPAPAEHEDSEPEILPGQFVDEDDEPEEGTGVESEQGQPQAEQPPMALAEAEAITTKQGTAYRDIPTDELRKAAESLGKQERDAKQETKLLAMQVIIKARTEAAQAASH